MSMPLKSFYNKPESCGAGRLYNMLCIYFIIMAALKSFRNIRMDYVK